jgi:hypothetical protein
VYLYTNDESYHGGLHRSKVSNLSSIKVRTVAFLKWHPQDYVPRGADPADLLGDLAPPETGVSAVSSNASPAAQVTIGWRRTPETNGTNSLSTYSTNWWEVSNGTLNYRKDGSSDLYIAYANRVADEATANVSRDLSIERPATSWTLNATIAMEGPNEPGVTEGAILEILDESSRAIATFETKKINDRLFRVLGNGRTLQEVTGATAMAAEYQFKRVINRLRSLTIRATNKAVVFAYDTNPSVTVPIVVASANTLRPKTFRVRFWSSTTSGVRHTVAFKTLRFAAN